MWRLAILAALRGIVVIRLSLAARPTLPWSTAPAARLPNCRSAAPALRTGSRSALRRPRRARSAMRFSDPDCAFDIRANVAGEGPVTWAGVNLCDVKSVTLNRDGSAGAWVDYDQ